MVMRAQAGLAFILAAVGDRGGVSSIHRGPRVGFQTDGEAVADGRGVLVEWAHDPELRPSILPAVADAIRELQMAHQAERRRHAVIEGLGAGHVVTTDGDVAEHRSLLSLELRQDAAGA